MVALFHAIFPVYSVESTLVRPSEQSQVYTEERKRYWEDYARSASKWVRLRSYYQFRLAEIYTLSVPPRVRVLELGCGDGAPLTKAVGQSRTAVDDIQTTSLQDHRFIDK
jgi:hypothetical protein